MPLLSAEQYEEIQNMANECDDRLVLEARMAELQALRRLHSASYKLMRAPLPFLKVQNPLPRIVGDTAAWKSAIRHVRGKIPGEDDG